MSARFWLAALVVGGGVSLAAPAWAAMSADEVAAAIAEAYGVTVLRVVPAKDDGRSVFRLTIMNPGGDFDEAFQVNTLLVDANTGKLVSGFRHRTSGYETSQAAAFETNRHAPDSLSWGFLWW